VRASADARIWIGLGLLILLALLFSLGRTAAPDAGVPEVTPLRSTYRARPSGLRALYLTLEQLGYRPRRHHQTLEHLSEDGALVIAEPPIDLAPREWEAVVHWVERGNLLLLFSDSGHLFEPDEHPAVSVPTAPTTAAPVQPVPVVAGARSHVVQALYRIDTESWSPVRPDGVFRAGPRRRRAAPPRLFPARPVLPLYADAIGPVLCFSRWGRGTVILSCSPWSLSNEGIARGSNLALFLNLLDAYGPAARTGGAAGTLGKRRPIFFDEYHQGQGDAGGPLSLLPPVARTGVAQVVVALLLLVVAVAWRFGAIVPTEALARRTRAEYLAAMTTLFRRARALELVAGKLKVETERELARSLGLPPTARPEELAAAAQEKRGLDAERVRRTLEEADLLSVARARRIPIDEHRVLALAVKLHDLREAAGGRRSAATRR
jgi:Domain of unknown function (DUF4350)